jgi:hypothetical protein
MLPWSDWLNEWIEWDGVHIRRHAAIRRFVWNGLVPFVESKGYAWACRPTDLQSRIATGLYKNQHVATTGSDWEFARENKNYIEHDTDHFWHVMNAEVWEAFWDRWGRWTDVDDDSWRGPDRRMDIQHYVWTQISLERSSQTQVVNELAGLSGDDRGEDWHTQQMVAAAREDVYLREAMESGEWGGYRK